MRTLHLRSGGSSQNLVLFGLIVLVTILTIVLQSHRRPQEDGLPWDVDTDDNVQNSQESNQKQLHPRDITIRTFSGVRTITLLLPGGKHARIKISDSSSESSIRDAIAIVSNLRPHSFGLVSHQSSEAITMAADLLSPSDIYEVIKIPTQMDQFAAMPHAHQPPPPPPPPSPPQREQVEEVTIKVSNRLDKIVPWDADEIREDDVIISGRKGVLPRVIVACLGTGRYRGLAIQALKSVEANFGGDCRLSVHLLTDDIKGVDPKYNPAEVPYREWPLSGLGKFQDILAGLGQTLQKADYFYFIDGDVHFKEHVLLADVAGDLVGVEHPMYPRHTMGFCKPGNKNTEGFCRYPYDRNPKSHCQIPDNEGRFYVKAEKKKPQDPEYVLRTSSWYFQSAFWGGKTKFVIPLLKELKWRTQADVDQNVISMVIQDERYFNYYMWKHGRDPDINIRVLGPSYLYPFNPQGFQDHIIKESRPIVVHGTAKPGKMIKDETELSIIPTGELEGKNLQCFDIAMLKGKVGTYACHNTEHRGGSQGFIWREEEKKLRIAYGISDKVKNCLDATGLGIGDAILSKKCDNKAEGQLFTYDKKEKYFRNDLTGLCLDPMRYDHQTYPEVGRGAKNAQWPVSLQPCGKSDIQRLKLTLVDVEESAQAADERMHNENRPGH